MCELFALSDAIRKFRHYLVGYHFIIRTDQQALRHLTSQTVHTPKQQKWLSHLLGFDFSIEYKPGRDNLATDALSRCFALTTLHYPLMSQIQALQQQDPTTTRMISELQSRSLQDSKFSWHQDLLWYNDRIYIPDNTTLQDQLLQEFHGSLLGGYVGTSRTFPG